MGIKNIEGYSMNNKMRINFSLLLTLLILGCATTTPNNIAIDHPDVEHALMNGDLGLIQKIVISSNKRKLYETDRVGQTLLHKASAYGKLKIVDYLVSEGANINFKDDDLETPLHFAINIGDFEIIEYLASHGANVNAKNNHGETPLHLAVAIGLPETVSYLISEGANINLQTIFGDTPLIYAAEKNNFELTKYLISEGADVSVKNNNGKTAFDLSVNYNDKKVANLLSSIVQPDKSTTTYSVSDIELTIEKGVEDTTPPRIIIYSYDTSKPIKVINDQRKIFLRGQVQDDSSIAELMINNTSVEFDDAGNFNAEIDLLEGENKIIIGVKDQKDNRGIKKVSIFREVPAVTAFGKNYALIIGNNEYQYMRSLKTAISDAQAVAEILKLEYAFNTKLLINASRNDIVNAINRFRKILKEEDSFILYYAGHGEFDKIANKAYWLPADAQRDSDTNWILADRITSNIRRMPSKHILIVADSCYSGTLTRRGVTDLASVQERDRYLKMMHTRKSRTLLASGGNEPVSDSGERGHSVFALAFLQGLKKMESNLFTAEELFYVHIKERVAGTSNQIPEYNIIINSGHEGGDFVFLRVNHSRKSN